MYLNKAKARHFKANKKTNKVRLPKNSNYLQYTGSYILWERRS